MESKIDPDPLKALSSAVDNAEQRVFEDWLQRTSPSGDCDSVHSQWLESSDFEDFCTERAEQILEISARSA
jgi:hypothetical protein